MSYKTRIIQYLKTHKGGLTVKECTMKIGTPDLRSRISELRYAGYIIKAVPEEGPNSNGTTSRYNRYFLIKEPDAMKRNVIKATKKVDKVTKALYHYDYLAMLDNLRMIRTNIEGKKKNDIQNI